MIESFLSRLRLYVGSATVDLILDKKEFLPGEKVTGHFLLKGGWFEQKIQRLECDLIAVDEQKEEEQMTGQAVTRLMSKKIGPNESSRIPFSYQLPGQLETTVHRAFSYRFRTKLVFGDGTKHVDHDQVTILNKKNRF